MSSEWTIDQTLEFAAGARAARNGEPFDPHETSLWIEGFRFQVSASVPQSTPQQQSASASPKHGETLGKVSYAQTAGV